MCSTSINKNSTFKDPVIDVHTQNWPLIIIPKPVIWHNATLSPGKCAQMFHFPLPGSLFLLPSSRVCARIELTEGFENIALCAYDDPVDFTDPPNVEGFGSYMESPWPHNTPKKKTSDTLGKIAHALTGVAGSYIAGIGALLNGNVEKFFAVANPVEIVRSWIGGFFDNYNVLMAGRIPRWKDYDSDKEGYDKLATVIPSGCAPVPLGPFPPPFHARTFFPMPFASLPVPVLGWNSTNLAPEVRLVWCAKDGPNGKVRTYCKDSVALDQALRPDSGAFIQPFTLAEEADPTESGVAFRGTTSATVPQEIPAALEWYKTSQYASAPGDMNADAEVTLNFEATISLSDPTKICVYYKTGEDSFSRTPLASRAAPHCFDRSITNLLPFVAELKAEEIAGDRTCSDVLLSGIRTDFATAEDNASRNLDKEDKEPTTETSFIDAVSALAVEGGEECLEDMADMIAKPMRGNRYQFMRKCLSVTDHTPPPPAPGDDPPPEPDPDAPPPKSCAAFDSVGCLTGYISPFKVLLDNNGNILEDTPNVLVRYSNAPATQYDRYSTYMYLAPTCLAKTRNECTNYITGCYGWSTKTDRCDPNDNHIAPELYIYGKSAETNYVDYSGLPCTGQSGGCASGFNDNVAYDAFSYDQRKYSLSPLLPEQLGLCAQVDDFSFFMTGDLARSRFPTNKYDVNSAKYLGVKYECDEPEICDDDPCRTAECKYEGKFFSSYACHSEAGLTGANGLTAGAKLEATDDGFSAGCAANIQAATASEPGNGSPMFNEVTIDKQGGGRDRATATLGGACKYYLVQAWGGGARAGDRMTGGGGGYAEIVMTPPEGETKLSVFVGEGGYRLGTKPEGGYRRNYYRRNIPTNSKGAQLEDTEKNDPDAKLNPTEDKENYKISGKIDGDGQDTVVMLGDKVLLVAEGGMTPTDYDQNSPASIQEKMRPPGGRAFVNLDFGDALKRVYIAEGGRGNKIDNMPRAGNNLDETYFDKSRVGYSSYLSYKRGEAHWNVMSMKGGSSGPFYDEVVGNIGERISGDAHACYRSFCENGVAREDAGVQEYITQMYEAHNLGPVSLKIPKELCLRDYLGKADDEENAYKGDIYNYTMPEGDAAFTPSEQQQAAVEPVLGYYQGAGLTLAATDRYIYKDVLGGTPSYGSGGCGMDQFISGEGWPGAVIVHCVRDNNDDAEAIDDPATVDFSDVITKINRSKSYVPSLSSPLYSCRALNVLLRRYDKAMKRWRYYECKLPSSMHGQFPESLNVCTEVWDTENVKYEFDLQPDASSSAGYRDVGEKSAGGTNYNGPGGDGGHGVWRIYPNPPYCDGGVWRF
jgi:hypothetical protein